MFTTFPQLYNDWRRMGVEVVGHDELELGTIEENSLKAPMCVEIRHNLDHVPFLHAPLETLENNDYSMNRISASTQKCEHCLYEGGHHWFHSRASVVYNKGPCPTLLSSRGKNVAFADLMVLRKGICPLMSAASPQPHRTYLEVPNQDSYL